VSKETYICQKRPIYAFVSGTYTHKHTNIMRIYVHTLTHTHSFVAVTRHNLEIIYTHKCIHLAYICTHFSRTNWAVTVVSGTILRFYTHMHTIIMRIYVHTLTHTLCVVAVVRDISRDHIHTYIHTFGIHIYTFLIYTPGGRSRGRYHLEIRVKSRPHPRHAKVNVHDSQRPFFRAKKCKQIFTNCFDALKRLAILESCIYIYLDMYIYITYIHIYTHIYS